MIIYFKTFLSSLFEQDLLYSIVLVRTKATISVVLACCNLFFVCLSVRDDDVDD